MIQKESGTVGIMKDHSKTVDFLRRRERARQERLDARFNDAWREFDRIVSYIVTEHRPKRIWQWGSLLERKKFSDISDLDIALEGLESTAELFQIVARAEELTDFPLDIIEMEKIAPEYRELIKRKGRLVYGST